jgi:hypothetical protein
MALQTIESRSKVQNTSRNQGIWENPGKNRKGKSAENIGAEGKSVTA